MNQGLVRSIWKQSGGMAKNAWDTLVHDPLAVVAGAHHGLAATHQAPRHNSMQEADRQLENFMIQHRNWQDLSMV